MPVICLLAAVPALRAQGDAMLTHYWVVPTYYNPAAAGDTDNIRIRGGMRMQWVGIDNAPRTFLALRLLLHHQTGAPALAKKLEGRVHRRHAARILQRAVQGLGGLHPRR